MKAIVLVSGGVESCVLLNEALAQYDKIQPLYIQNHLRWEDVEIFWLKKFLRNFKSLKIEPLKILELSMRDLYEGHWSLTGIKVPGAQSKDESVYLPGRNIMFLSKAAIFAAIHEIPVIEIGILKGNPFSDSSKAFLSKLSGILSMGLSYDIEIKAPFQKYRKEDVIDLGKKLPLECTFSCINPKGFEHCGECNKCVERKKAFFSVGMTDKTKYKKAGL